MAARKMMTVVAVVLSAILATILPSDIVAQSSCQNEIASLSLCYPYIDGNCSNPSPQCCNRIDNVVKTQPQCLCEVLNENGLNKTRVMALPGACNVQTPPASYCYSLPPSGYSTKISNSMLLSVLTAASYAGILMII